ncbi:alpha/beta hydrolase [Sediminibacillus massiliensis]|uniref:alpha/beta hydrolase n=1 Tax=Sediminibacillus massiliensis TaxID=1926277 RepID=UPI0009883089|nr:alpha/beta hydrolase family protein [Sediminibacillus massiliensis]
MALIKCEFFSEMLRLSTSMTVILPQETNGQIGMQNKKIKGSHPTLYLLHGFSDDDTIWTRRTSIERYAAEYGLAVVMPNADHSYYTDMRYGKKYWTFLTEELPEIARSFFPLSDKREDNFVAGLSMGGYGALKWALNCPDRFAAAASLSGVTDMVSHLDKVKNNESPFEGPLFLAFGEDRVEGTYEDLLAVIKQQNSTSNPKPLLYQACGTEDFLYEENVTFQQLCNQTDYELTTDFGPGDHEWGYWDNQIQKVLEWLPLKTR